jgi:hypothetical protein
LRAWFIVGPRPRSQRVAARFLGAGFQMWRVRVVCRGSGGMWFSGSRDRANTEGSDFEGITGSSYCNQEDVHCRSDMKQSLVC